MIFGHDLVLVIDHGSPSAQVIARRVREAAVYSELIPGTTAIEEILERKPSAIILSGGAVSVHADDAPQLDPALFEAGVPVLGISHGFQAMAAALGGTVERTGTTEKGLTTLSILNAGCLLNTLPNTVNVWMDHEDAVTRPPEGFRTLARTAGAPVAAFEDRERLLAGVQWHPQDPESQWGQQVLEHFLFNMAQVEPTWTPENIVEQSIKQIRDTVGEKRVLCALSGGVDSAVAAALVQKAIGSQLTCVFVDHGLLREGEAEQVRSEFVRITGVDLVSADETERFLSALAGVSDPETKRKIIGREFIRTFEATAGALAGERGIDFLVQGTLYPDVVESGGGTGHENIKSHHNVGGLPDDLGFTLIEPLRNMFKDEVRAVGTQLGLPESLVWRHPFPGPGLGIRIIGEVTAERLDILRRADAIAREELAAARLEREIWQFPVVLLADVRSVGVLDQARTYGHPIVLRPVTSEDAMSAEWAQLPNELLARISSRITSEVPEVNRVVIDITNKPPGTIEWE